MKDPFSRPAVTGQQLAKDLGKAMDGKFSQSVNDPRFTAVFSWIAVVMGMLVTGLLCWITHSITDLQQSVAVLLARPESVSRVEYVRDAERWERDIDELKRYRDEHPKQQR